MKEAYSFGIIQPIRIQTMNVENHIRYEAAQCENEDTQVRRLKCWNEIMGTPEGWKGMFDKPVAEAVRQLDGELVVERTLSLKEFKRRIDGLRFQLIENWCLCKYCQFYDQTSDSFGLWISEFNACAKYIRDSEVKGKIDKKKTIHAMFIDDYDYNQERKILTIIREKFDVKNIKDMSMRNTIATSFVNSIGNLIDFLVNTQTSIADYDKETFQYQR